MAEEEDLAAAYNPRVVGVLSTLLKCVMEHNNTVVGPGVMRRCSGRGEA
jgi:hypothetical protein